MHAFLHILGIAALVVGGIAGLIVLLIVIGFARASARGENPFQ